MTDEIQQITEPMPMEVEVEEVVLLSKTETGRQLVASEGELTSISNSTRTKKRRVRTDEYKAKQKLNIKKKRQVMTDEQKETERTEASNRMKLYRDKMTNEQKQTERTGATNRMKRHRSNMTTEQKESEREKNKQQKISHRAAQSGNQKETIRENNRLQQQEHRAAQSDEQKDSSRETNKLEHRDRRAKEDGKKRSQPRASVRDDSELDAVEEYLAGDEEGNMDITCVHCGAKGFQQENQGTKKRPNLGSICCCNGQVDGIADYNLPPALEHLYVDEVDPLAEHFTQHTRTYNNGMSMSSLALEKGKRWQTRAHKLESMLTSSGQLLGPLIKEDGTRPKCVQAYFYGPEEATYYRLKNFPNIPKKERVTYETVFKQLHGILMNAGNRYIQSYLGVKDYVEQHLKDKVWDVKLSLHANESADDRVHSGRLNVPTVKEIAILLPNDLTAKHERQVVFNYMQGDGQSGLRFIADFHKAYDPLQYPLLFPDGQDGWHDDLPHTSLQHVNFMLNDTGTALSTPSFAAIALANNT
ncbi:MAG: hypothetical protein ACR2NF_02935 [Pirellulales bacterium]